MSRDDVNAFSETPADNTDVGGVGIQGSNLPSNLDNAIRSWLSIWAAFVAGTDPLDASFLLQDPDDDTKTARFDLSNIPTGTARSIDLEGTHRNGAYIETVYTASGTHTFADATKFFEIEAAGAGGGGGGADGQGASTYAAASGGSSGFFGKTRVISRASLTTGTVTIGAAGAGGAGPNNGSDGGNTSWSDGTNSFTWNGGKGGFASVGNNGNSALAASSTLPTYAGTIDGTSVRGEKGHIATSSFSGGVAGQWPVIGGDGGHSTFGPGGKGGSANSAADDGAAASVNGYGGGGGGACSSNVNTNGTGGAGSGGILIVREW